MNKGPLASQWEAKSVGENQSSKMSLLRRASLSSPKPCPLWPPKQSIRQSQDPEIDNKIQSREAVRQQDLLIAPANAALCCKLSIHAAPNCQSGWLSSISLCGMSELLTGNVQAGFGKASHWLNLFNVAYSEKLGISVFPGSLNIALDHVFDWFDARYEAHRIWFGREEYGGERDILLLPCQLVSLGHRRAFLWTPTTAARDRRDPWVVEIVADVNLRDHFGLQDGDVVEITVPTSGVQR